MTELTRRSLLCTAAAAALSGCAGVAAPAPRTLRAAPARVSLVGAGHPHTAVWAYDARIPGPLLRARQGEPFALVLDNALDAGTTIHWHGVRVPIAMDGVPGISQPPVAPGERFAHAFTPPDAGTYWYHPHADSLRQLGRGLAGVLVVDERVPAPHVDRDVVWTFGDWRLRPDAQLAENFGDAHDAATAGRIGNTVTLNGRVSDAEPARAGERWRLRLVNTALARILALRFEGHRPSVVAIDGQPCVPHEPAGGRVLLGPGMRVDLVLDLVAAPGSRHRVIDEFVPSRAWRVTELVYDNAPARRDVAAAAPVAALPPNPLPEPALAGAERIEIRLQGGMHSPVPYDMRHGAWAIDGHAMTGDGHAAMAPRHTITRGRSCVLTMVNDTAWWHPMHLHGHSFRVLRRNGRAVPHTPWADTALVAPRETLDVAFVADNPGDWMLHCHVIDHQAAGMMTLLRVA